MNVLVTGSTGYIGGRLVPPIAVVDFWRVEGQEIRAQKRWTMETTA
jgi:uncharacterized protein YbjT (DUF2867 family)